MNHSSHNQGIGKLGEDIAQKYLENKGFVVLDRNYLKKYGEIDIVAKKAGIIHFIEVKSVSCENLDQDVSCVTDNYRPEDNVHPQKLKRLGRTIQAYLLEKFPKGDPEWIFDVVTVRINSKNLKAQVKFLENLVL